MMGYRVGIPGGWRYFDDYEEAKRFAEHIFKTTGHVVAIEHVL